MSKQHLRLMLLLEATLRRLFPDTRLSRPPSTRSPDTLLSLIPLPWMLIPETLRSLMEAASKVPPDILRSRAISLSSCRLSKLLGPLSPLYTTHHSKSIHPWQHLDIVLQLSEMSLVSAWLAIQGILLNIWLNVFFSAWLNKLNIQHPVSRSFSIW